MNVDSGRTATMTTESIDYIAPIRRALDRTMLILFRPFDMIKWLVIGFTAWLANLLSGGGGGGGGGSALGKAKDQLPDVDSVKEYAGETANTVIRFMQDYAGMLGLILIALLILGGIVLLVVLTWVSSRGKFMFLDNVLNNRSEITSPWTEFRVQGDSLFLWRIIFGVAATLSLVAVVGLGIFSVLPFLRARQLVGMAIGGGVSAGLILIAMLLCLGYIALFVEDFLLPIMHRNRIGIVAAWRIFKDLIDQNFGFFLLYGLLKFGINAVIGTVTMVLIIAACCFCCLGIILMLPFVGTVALLPIHVFKRCLGPEFLDEIGNPFTEANTI
jgi:hypothetical protein